VPDAVTTAANSHGFRKPDGRLRRGRNARALTALSVLLLVGGTRETPPAAAGVAAANRTGSAGPPLIALPISPPLPGEGVWVPSTFRVGGAAPIMTTTFRPEPRSPSVIAYVAWIDHTRTRLALYPGSTNPPSASPRGTGQVPPGQRSRLLATFNSGFKWDARPGGFVINGHADEPLLPGFGTLVAYPNGRVDIVRWHGPPTLPSLVLARQNLPLLVDGGLPSPTIDKWSNWGATLRGLIWVWRTAVGIDRHGNLIYAAAPSQTPTTLAALMISLGAVRAIELDINPEWPGFNSYMLPGGLNPVALMPNPLQSADRWLTPDSRDFFAVYTRAGGASVPFR
jgi:hypothetical protein